ncbi:hypothetical protein DFH09DRAFT_1284470 [Mycena vulgaris]|nr:hypothetical protein DFH09DRAFT_1284470 [Mycena vulgaris]
MGKQSEVLDIDQGFGKVPSAEVEEKNGRGKDAGWKQKEGVEGRINRKQLGSAGRDRAYGAEDGRTGAVGARRLDSGIRRAAQCSATGLPETRADGTDMDWMTRRRLRRTRGIAWIGANPAEMTHPTLWALHPMPRPPWNDSCGYPKSDVRLESPVFSIRELCDKILDHISHSHSQDNLKSTTLVCHALGVSAQGQIFRHVILDTTPTSSVDSMIICSLLIRHLDRFALSCGIHSFAHYSCTFLDAQTPRSTPTGNQLGFRVMILAANDEYPLCHPSSLDCPWASTTSRGT